MLNWRQSRCLVASIANAALVCFPAWVMNDGHVPPYAALAIVIAAACEGLVTSPQRIAATGNGCGMMPLWNVVQGVAVLVCLQSFAVMSTPGGEGWEVIGAIALMSGIALRTAAIWTLGQHFGDGFEPSASHRVTVGPYRFVRHPAELGLLLMIAGFGTLVCGWSILTVAIFAFLAAVSTVRVVAEELVLEGIAANDPASREGNRVCGSRFSRHLGCEPWRSDATALACELIHVSSGNAHS